MAVNPSTTQLHELTSCNASRVPGHETADDLESESDEQESVPLSQQFHPVLAIVSHTLLSSRLRCSSAPPLS